MREYGKTTWGHAFGRRGEATLRQNIKDQDRKTKQAAAEKARLKKEKKDRERRRRREVRVSKTLKKAKERV